MSPRDVFELYRSELLGQSYPGFSVEVLPHLSRHTACIAGVQGWVMFARLDAVHAGRQIDEQVKYFEERGEPFEWKIHDFDSPDTLKTLLEQRGFRCEETEAFLVIPIENWSATANRPESVSIQKISDERQLVEYVSTEEAIWSESFPEHLQKYTHQLRTAPDTSSIYCAYLDGKPVATGRVEFPPGSNFARLYGGGVLPAMRGRGVFSAMLSHRIAEAKARGYRWITVDAAPMSRPILLKKGFMHVCWTYPMCWRPITR